MIFTKLSQIYYLRLILSVYKAVLKKDILSFKLPNYCYPNLKFKQQEVCKLFLRKGCKMRHKMISVIGSDLDGCSQETLQFAESLGKRLAKGHFGIICDGKSGISEIVCKALVDADHDAPVVALVNGSDIACHNAFCSVVIPTGQAWGSDRLVANGGDVVLVIGGGIPVVGLLDFLCTTSDKQVLCVTGISSLLDTYLHEHLGNEHITPVKSVDEILWYLEVLTEEFSFLPKKTVHQKCSDHTILQNSTSKLF